MARIEFVDRRRVRSAAGRMCAFVSAVGGSVGDKYNVGLDFTVLVVRGDANVEGVCAISPGDSVAEKLINGFAARLCLG